ncbi:FAD/NAD(P)-binding domain-containing protein [Stipitochalara longipes BDJ]|nr:FAD/NAD(P)-binding domain-containing protein [Stipitochalara longipes BDJ]
MASFKIIIIGGGLSGALLANGLMLHEIEFMIYEKDERGSKRAGYQVRLGAPAIAGFKACLPPERMALLMRKFGRSGGLISSAPILYDTKFNCLLDLTKFPAYTKSAPINRLVLRNFLLEPVDAVGKIQYSKRFVSYETLEKKGAPGRIKIQFEDGTSDEADLVVSAEGSHSKINKQIGLNNIVQLTAKWGFLAKGSLSASKLQSLPTEIEKSSIASYLPDSDPTNSGLKYDENNASVFWGLTIPAEDVPREGAKAISNKLEFCINIIQDWDPRYHSMLRSIDDGDIYAFQARASKQPPNNWRSTARINVGAGVDRLWLIGDAIHPMLPSRGMGGNQAMNDTADAIEAILNLAEIAKAGKIPSDDDLQREVTKYESRMMPRSFGWVKTSGGIGGDVLEPDSLKGRISLWAVARLLDLAYIYSLLRWVVGFRPVDDAPELPD